MVYIVTGADKGIGRAIAKELLEQEEDVIGTSRPGSKRFNAANLSWFDLELDSPSSLSLFISKMSSLSEINGLVNNAGINVIEGTLELSDENLRKILEVNLSSQISLISKLSQKLIVNHGGRIVNISSIWSQVGKPGRVAYAASKAGLAGATRVLALDLAPYGVLVNSVSPGFTETELTRTTMSGTEILEIEKQIPLGRLAQPDEIARLVYFLISRHNTYITGQNITIDGGFTIA